MLKFNVGDTVQVAPDFVIGSPNNKEDVSNRKLKVLFSYTNIDGRGFSVCDLGSYQEVIVNDALFLVEKSHPIPSEDLHQSELKIEENGDRLHPSYYQHPSGVECIIIARHHNFDIGNALKYLWRAGLKQEEGLSSKDKEIEDLQKAVWYINDWINELKGL